MGPAARERPGADAPRGARVWLGRSTGLRKGGWTRPRAWPGLGREGRVGFLSLYLFLFFLYFPLNSNASTNLRAT